MSKRINKLSAMLTAILTSAIAQVAYATPTIIDDNYIGGNDHKWGDVIGDKNLFDVYSMDVELLAGNLLSVSINTNFAGRGDNGLFSGYTYDGNGIGYGDLFLSGSWTPCLNVACSSPYKTDNNANGTIWEYGFSLDDRYKDGGTGSLYSLNGDNSDVLLSENFLKGATFRNGQEIAVDTTNKKAINSSSWDLVADTNNTVGKINFLIDLNGTTLAGSDTIALHWGMSCGNDTIEGEYSVPEPAILGLLAIGLIGVGVSKRNKT